MKKGNGILRHGSVPSAGIHDAVVKEAVMRLNENILLLASAFENIRMNGQVGLIEIHGQRGAKGDKGDKGDTGPKGDKGDKGDAGVKGDKGDPGGMDTLMEVTNRGDKADKIFVLRMRNEVKNEIVSGNVKGGTLLWAGVNTANWDGERFISINPGMRRSLMISNKRADIALFGIPVNNNIPDGQWYLFTRGDDDNNLLELVFLTLDENGIPASHVNGSADEVYLTGEAWVYSFDGTFPFYPIGWSGPHTFYNSAYIEYSIMVNKIVLQQLAPVYEPIATMGDIEKMLNERGL